MTLMDTTTTDPPAMRWPTLPDGRYAVLRCCHPDGTSSHGFTWPLTVGATVEAPDWDPNPGRDCGGGLHGLLWGCGTADLLSPQDGVWMLVAVDPADIATPHDLVPDKVRFRAGEVVHVGDKESAVGWLVDRAPGLPVVFATATAGDRGTATAGYEGTATAGYWGTATAGDRGTATAGDRGTATAGDRGTATAGYEGTATAGSQGTATAGDRGTATAGDRGTATAGYRGTATAGDGGTATAGDRGTATAGDWGTATAGDRGTATAGYRGTATAGDRGTATAGDRGTATAGDWGTATAGYEGCISILRWDGKAYRRRVAEVDGTTIRAGVPYQLDADGNFVEVER